MSFADRFTAAFRYVLPSPFAIAVLLTLFTFLIALFFTQPAEISTGSYALQLVEDWSIELWNGDLMVFAMQMMLMLVLGHVLALSPVVDRAIQVLLNRLCRSADAAVAWVCFFTLLVSFFNWGLGLIFGAIFARKVGALFLKRHQPLNYALVGAAGYAGLMVWHGGISGSSLVKVAEPGHLKSLMATTFSSEQLAQLPEQLSYATTVFSPMNVAVSVLLLVLLPLLVYFLSQQTHATDYTLVSDRVAPAANKMSISGAERIDYSRGLGSFIGAAMLAIAIWLALSHADTRSFSFINPNWINLLLFGLCLLCHQRFSSFLEGVEKAIGDASGILIQFPLYFGIMGLMKSSGMVVAMAEWFAANATVHSYPILTFFSAALVNIFVPSGGGQWAVQGPVIIQSAQQMGVSLEKSILALAYGDQITNMLQPFWALPLLGITQLKAKQILPYTLILMLVGGFVFLSALLIF